MQRATQWVKTWRKTKRGWSQIHTPVLEPVLEERPAPLAKQEPELTDSEDELEAALTAWLEKENSKPVLYHAESEEIIPYNPAPKLRRSFYTKTPWFLAGSIRAQSGHKAVRTWTRQPGLQLECVQGMQHSDSESLNSILDAAGEPGRSDPWEPQDPWVPNLRATAPPQPDPYGGVKHRPATPPPRPPLILRANPLIPAPNQRPPPKRPYSPAPSVHSTASTAPSAHGVLAAEKTWWAIPDNFAAKYRVYNKGKKQRQQINRLPEPSVDKLPLFVKEEKTTTHTTPICKSVCNKGRLLASLTSDADLVAYLKLQSAYAPRTVELARQLKQQGMRYLARYDMSLYTVDETRKMVLNAVAQAMMIQPEEEKLRSLMHTYEERVIMRPLMNQFLTSGRTGSGASACLTSPPTKVSALRKFFQRRLIRGIKF